MINRVAATQRVIENDSYPETRDALSQEWATWLKDVSPGAVLLPVPNQPLVIKSWWQALEPDVLILTGGNNWGESPVRDETERVLVEIARSQGALILGVCRGLQVLNVLSGGRLVTDLNKSTNEKHAANNHQIVLCSATMSHLAGSENLVVNSYHDQGVLSDGLVEEFFAFAVSKGGVVEGLYHRKEPILAVQWHPERNSPSHLFDQRIVRKFFKSGPFWLDFQT